MRRKREQDVDRNRGMGKEIRKEVETDTLALRGVRSHPRLLFPCYPRSHRRCNLFTRATAIYPRTEPCLVTLPKSLCSQSFSCSLPHLMFPMTNPRYHGDGYITPAVALSLFSDVPDDPPKTVDASYFFYPYHLETSCVAWCHIIEGSSWSL